MANPNRMVGDQKTASWKFRIAFLSMCDGIHKS